MENKQFKYKSYDDYINRQKRGALRTKHKTVKGQQGRLTRIKELLILYPTLKNVLCLGSRHPQEIETFLENNYQAVGIDLYSNLPHIIKCDMSKFYEHPAIQKKKAI